MHIKKESLSNKSLIISDGSKKLTIPMDLIKRASLTLRALSLPVRFKIIALLEQHGTLRVTEIYKTLKIEQSVASTQLAILRRAGMVTAHREGRIIQYSLNKKRIKEVVDLMPSLFNEDEAQV